MPLAAAMICIAFVGCEGRAPESGVAPSAASPEAALQHATPRQRVMGHGIPPTALIVDRGFPLRRQRVPMQPPPYRKTHPGLSTRRRRSVTQSSGLVRRLLPAPV